MKVKTNAILAIPTAESHSANDGCFIKLDDGKSKIVSAANAAPFGVILSGAPEGGNDSVAVCAGGYSGTLRVKLSKNPGNIDAGTLLVLDGTSLGTVKAAPASGARVVVAQALEWGTADELIEAVLVTPIVYNA